MDTDDLGRGLTRFRRYTWWSLTSGAVLLLLIPATQWLSTGPFPVWQDLLRWSGVAVTAAACVRITQVLLPADRPRPIEDAPAGPGPLPSTWLVAGVAGAVTASAMMLVQGDVLFWSLPIAMLATFVSALLPVRQRVVLLVTTGVGSAVVVALWTTFDGEGLYVTGVWFALGVVGFLAFLKLAQVWTYDVAARLDDARHVAGELAVADERLRFAAELHDIQGHSLQVIALQSELAARLAERDPERAAAQMREVQALAADALRDTRELVRGYRATSLRAEIANATRVLGAASIDGRMLVAADLDLDGLDESHRRLLGLVVREATTNILRHSDARHATVELATVDGSIELRVSNDGAPGDADTAAHELGGLHDLARRLRSLGGDLTTTQAQGSFELLARVPASGQDAPAPSTRALEDGPR
jgi:two-component system sensor histidine kinase DesK